MLKFLQILCLFGGFLVHQVAAQDVSGKVTDADGTAIPGVNVLVEGTSKGTVTDIDGNYALTLVENENVLVFSFVGYVTQRVEVGAQQVINITLQDDVAQLDEVVVIGYGTMEEKDLTSSITTISSEEIVKTPTPQAMQALQGKVPGVQIVSSGAPGASPTVRVRGVGTFQGNSAPLYVVDGMFFDNIDFLNTNDIATITVLKDASATAIYGVRASNGVVLIETKSGEFDAAPTITYSGYYGVQHAQNVLQMSNSEQFVRYINETGNAAEMSFIDNAMQRYGRSEINPNVPDVNTDWYDQIIQTAPIQNHTLTVSGGGANTRYSISGSYFNQDGLLKHTNNSFERINLRTKLDVKAADWLNVGGTMLLNGSQQYIGENAAWFNAYFAVPIMPVYDEQNVNAYPYMFSNANEAMGYRGVQNPMYPLTYNDNRNNIAKVAGNIYGEIVFIPEQLTFKSQFNFAYANVNTRNVDFPYSNGNQEFNSGITKIASTELNTIWDNYLTYENYWDEHHLTVVAGYSFRAEQWEELQVRGDSLTVPVNRDLDELWYLNFGTINDDATGDNGRKYYGSSYFGRLAYDYDGRYLLYATLRRDGTSKFQGTWGLFPTVGVGWVISRENFWNVEAIDFLKFRASWGQLGNDGISPAYGAPYLDRQFLALNDVRYQGARVIPVYDYIDTWEFTEETNIGITAELLNSRLSLDADWYIRDTKDAVIPVTPPLIRTQVRRNFGSIRNTGLEVALNWSDDVGSEVRYNIGANFATLKNEVLELGGQEYLDQGQAEFRQRSIIGEPYQAFFGYEVEGVFQNQQQIANSGLTSEFIDQNNLVPGDLIFRDQNADGVIDDLDRVVLGSILPEFTYGFNFGVSYKNLALSATFQGQAGHSILNRKRGEVIFTPDPNIDADLANGMWRGEGTSNEYPSAAGYRKAYNQSMSEFYVEKGDYFRIQNVQLSYNIVNQEMFGVMMPEATIILTAERPLTVFQYNGFNPEVADGIDRQTYPIPAIYTIGLNVKL